jgi:ribokinase
MTSRRSVICVGDVMVDVLARLSGPLVTGSDTAATIDFHGGGSAANTAAWLARAAVPVTLVARVGADEFGRAARAALLADGVRAELTVDPHRPTGTCIVLVDRAGERTMVPSVGANDGPVAVPDELWAPGVQLHVSGYALLHAGSRASALAALATAGRLGASVSVDAASTAPLVEAGPREFLAWLPPGVLLLANADEAGVLTGAADPIEAADRLGAVVGEVVVKLGPAGATWSDGTQSITVPTVARPPVDSTGAGDAFAAGLLAARLAGADVAASLAAGNRLAGEAISHPGARPIHDRV